MGLGRFNRVFFLLFSDVHDSRVREGSDLWFLPGEDFDAKFDDQCLVILLEARVDPPGRCDGSASVSRLHPKQL